MNSKYICGIAMIAFLAIGAGMALNSMMKASGRSGDQSLLNGSATALYEADFDKNLLHRDASIQSWNAMGYVLFGEGKEGVLIGQDGWLFTNEEFLYSDDYQDNFNKAKSYILKIQQEAESKNIKLIILPIPAKSRLYKKKLGKYKFPDYAENNYSALVAFLNNQKISYVNLLKLFEKNTKSNIFLKTDTHWTPLGARIASLEMQQYVTSRYPYLTWDLDEHHSVRGESFLHEGDLMRYTVNGRIAEGLGIKKDQINKWQTSKAQEDGASLFTEINLPVTLVGTSYSANKLWNFEGFLKEALGTDILNMADEGLGPFETMRNYMVSDSYKNNPPKLILWEIPERYTVMPNKIESE